MKITGFVLASALAVGAVWVETPQLPCVPACIQVWPHAAPEQPHAHSNSTTASVTMTSR